MEGKPQGFAQGADHPDREAAKAQSRQAGLSTPPQVQAILSGNALPTRIFGGTPPDSRLDRIDWADVDRIDVAVHLTVHGDDLDHLWIERWVRDRVVGRIPGGRRAVE